MSWVKELQNEQAALRDIQKRILELSNAFRTTGQEGLSDELFLHACSIMNVSMNLSDIVDGKLTSDMSANAQSVNGFFSALGES